VHDALHKREKLYAYKLQLVQRIACKNQNFSKQFALEMFPLVKTEEIYLNRICFSDETMFHVVEQSTGPVAMYRVKILVKLPNLSVIHQRSICGVP
jgi:hypothetical protein